MTGNAALDLLFSAGGAAILATIITAIVNRKKLSADATEVITKAAAGTVETIMKDNAALRERLAALESKLSQLTIAIDAAEKRERAHDAIEERYRWHLDRWHRYCTRITDELRAVGGKIEDPPPMWPDLATLFEE